MEKTIRVKRSSIFRISNIFVVCYGIKDAMSITRRAVYVGDGGEAVEEVEKVVVKTLTDSEKMWMKILSLIAFLAFLAALIYSIYSLYEGGKYIAANPRMNTFMIMLVALGAVLMTIAKMIGKY
jgi:succinate dehydrogenase/fumarate reductase cytochrome b subunit